MILLLRRCVDCAACDQQGHLQGLLVVQPRVDIAVIRTFEICLLESTGASNTLGDVFSGQLEMNAAKDRIRAVVDIERLI